MNNKAQSKFALAGWFVAAGLGVLLITSGFQSAQPKFGVVDVNRVIQQSEIGQSNQARIRDFYEKRNNLLQFMDTYRVMSVDQAQRLRDLELKANPTEAEKQEVERIKQSAIANTRQLDALSQKQPLTDEERNQLTEYNRQSQETARLLAQLNQQFNVEFDDYQATVRQDTINSAMDAAKQVAAREGYTLVFEAQFAIYGANDVTDEAIRIMNAR